MPSGQMESRVLRRQQAYTFGNGINGPPFLFPRYHGRDGNAPSQVWVGTSQEMHWEMEQRAHFLVPAFPSAGSGFRNGFREDGLSLRDLHFLPRSFSGHIRSLDLGEKVWLFFSKAPTIYALAIPPILTTVHNLQCLRCLRTTIGLSFT